MKKILTYLIAFFLMYSCQKDDEANNMDTVSLDIENENLITSTNSLINGQAFILTAEINNTRVVDYSIFKIRNISNENVIITLDDFGDLSIRTNSASEQSFSFEIYHNEEKIKSFSGNVKPQFNLIDNNSLIDGPLLLNVNYDNQSFEYKLVNSNASPIQNFNLRDISFRQSLNPIHLDDHEVVSGNNFKIVFNLNNSGNQTTSLYYNSNSEPIFVKDIIITNNLNTSPSKFSCSTITNKMFSSRVGETLGRPREAIQYYVGKNNIVSSESLNFINTKRQFIYNSNNKLSQVLDMFSKKVQITYEYTSNGLIKQSNFFQESDTKSFKKYYYDDTSQNLIAVVNCFENTKGIQLIDSIANLNFVSNKPTRIEKYNFENTLIPTDFVGVTFFRVSYENNGNTIRKEISLDDVNYVLSSEEKFSPDDKVLVPFNSSTGEVLVEEPLLIESKIFADYKAEPINPPSVKTLNNNIERDNNNTITFTEHILDSKYNFINELIFEENNEDCL